MKAQTLSINTDIEAFGQKYCDIWICLYCSVLIWTWESLNMNNFNIILMIKTLNKQTNSAVSKSVSGVLGLCRQRWACLYLCLQWAFTGRKEISVNITVGKCIAGGPRQCSVKCEVDWVSGSHCKLLYCSFQQLFEQHFPPNGTVCWMGTTPNNDKSSSTRNQAPGLFQTLQ